ncbi:MAG: hypothetical protein DDT19_02809 [Syntrophomonadaceae bacterium]|nr:hypothetical protein [Bacillota bacterium]
MVYGVYKNGELIRLRAICDRCGTDIADPSSGEVGDRYTCWDCEGGIFGWWRHIRHDRKTDKEEGR